MSLLKERWTQAPLLLTLYAHKVVPAAVSRPWGVRGSLFGAVQFGASRAYHDVSWVPRALAMDAATPGIRHPREIGITSTNESQCRVVTDYAGDWLPHRSGSCTHMRGAVERLRNTRRTKFARHSRFPAKRSTDPRALQ